MDLSPEPATEPKFVSRFALPGALSGVALRTSLFYWVLAAAYILLSDRIVEAIVRDPEVAARVQTFKGWGFVTVTALLLYFGLRGQLRRWEREVNERRRAEDALRTRMTQIRAILDHQPVAFFACDPTNHFTLWEGRSWPEANVPPANPVGRDLSAMLGMGTVSREAVRRALQGETVLEEHRSAGKNFEIIHTPLNDERGQRIGTAGVVVETTERHKLEAQLLRAQRLESVGRLAGGVAHDVNNILAPVLLGASLLRHAELDDAQRSLLETMEASARRGAAIIRQLLVFSRGAEGERGPVAPAPLITEMRNFVRETFPRNIAISTNPGPNDLFVRGDATQLHQVLLNLCVNARDAMPDGGEIVLDVERVTIDAAAASTLPDAAPGDYVVFSVRDTGTGIAPDVLDRIFDPFFTTKAVGVGTGLGLSTVLGIVKSHGGFITVDSYVGKGTTFRVHLPVGVPATEGRSSSAADELPRGRGEGVLVVDDEQSIRYLVRQALELGGYRVFEAANGVEGLACLDRHQTEVQVVLTDLMMPLLDGRSFVRDVRALHRSLPIMAMTGVGDSTALDELRQLGVDVQLTKPFTADALLRTVHRSLAARRPGSR